MPAYLVNHPNPTPPAPPPNCAITAAALDRAADAALFYGRATTAERLSTRAAELREGGQ